MKSIDLKMTYGDMSEPAEMPSEHYPSFRYEGTDDLGLPDEGTAVINFKKVASEQSERDGKERYSCTVEVRKLSNVKGGEGKADGAEEEAPAEEMDEKPKANKKSKLGSILGTEAGY